MWPCMLTHTWPDGGAKLAAARCVRWSLVIRLGMNVDVLDGVCVSMADGYVLGTSVVLGADVFGHIVGVTVSVMVGIFGAPVGVRAVFG